MSARGLVSELQMQQSMAVERERELCAREYTCPDCGSLPGSACSDASFGRAGLVFSIYSHTRRYQLAVADGLVPPTGASIRRDMEPDSVERHEAVN